MKYYKVVLKKEISYFITANSHDEAVDKAIEHDIQQGSHWSEDPYMEMNSEEVP